MSAVASKLHVSVPTYTATPAPQPVPGIRPERPFETALMGLGAASPLALLAIPGVSYLHVLGIYCVGSLIVYLLVIAAAFVRRARSVLHARR